MTVMEKNKQKMMNALGHINQVVGVVVDVEFEKGQLPAIYNALEVELNGKNILLEVAQHLDETSVRAISLASTDGLKRGSRVQDTGAAISVPIGDATQGRMFSVTGEPIDGQDVRVNAGVVDFVNKTSWETRQLNESI